MSLVIEAQERSMWCSIHGGTARIQKKYERHRAERRKLGPTQWQRARRG